MHCISIQQIKLLHYSVLFIFILSYCMFGIRYYVL